ncbi:hypothetical protein TNCT_215751 [Trichonephila clavata]|uniref:Uncharacterized protein n=1 Tax=Trichonephila clavata TaxID=2740835 RepID=A0A8X6FHP1_TRICU|nr:hypothetical protein TNCT_215751 [Trichonephila clavata]
MEESDFSDDCSEKQVRQKDATPAAIPGMPGSESLASTPLRGTNFGLEPPLPPMREKRQRNTPAKTVVPTLLLMCR